MEATTVIVVYIVIAAIIVLPWAQIFKKSGNNPWYSLIMIIPVINIVAFILFASEEWPIIKSNAKLRENLKKQEHTMICDKCGNPIAEQDRFCSACGTEFETQPDTCPNCKKKILTDGKFCPYCGAQL